MKLEEIKAASAAEARVKRMKANAKAAKGRAKQLKAQADIGAQRLEMQQSRHRLTKIQRSVASKPIQPYC